MFTLFHPSATVMHEREHSSRCMSTSTAQFYFGVSKLTKAVWCYINEAAFLEASFPREERDMNKENKFFLSEKFGAYNCNNYPKLTCLGASIMQSWSLFTGTNFMLAVNLTDTLTYPSINSSSIPLSIYLSIHYLGIHPSIHLPCIHPLIKEPLVCLFIISSTHLCILQLFVPSFFLYFLLQPIHSFNQPTKQYLWAPTLCLFHHFPVFMVK